MSKVMVMSFPLMLSNISPGTTVEPFISTLITLPSSAFSSSERMTSQPILPSAPLMNGCFVPCAGIPALPLSGVVPGLAVFPLPGFTGVVPVPGAISFPGLVLVSVDGVTNGCGVVFPLPGFVLPPPPLFPLSAEFPPPLLPEPPEFPPSPEPPPLFPPLLLRV
ncbi:hypothetical protein IMSAGC013_02619 [Lachnospiraceae bacterium]|nr:hypothetical protein IMSAGC013_02619 [Lachnospiraceae bacterium]